MKRLRPDAPTRKVTEIGPGDYVKVGSVWRRVEANSAHGAQHTPRDWTIRSEAGTHGMWGVNRYAKAEDLEER